MRKQTVLYRDPTGRGWRLKAGTRVPAGWLTDEQYRTKVALERRMREESYENRQRLMDDVRTRARVRKSVGARPEGPG